MVRASGEPTGMNRPEPYPNKPSDGAHPRADDLDRDKGESWGERWFRSLVQNSSDVITVLEADGTVRYVSPAIERMLGYTPEERVGRNGFELLHPDDLARARSKFDEALRNPGVTLSIGVRMRHRDGSWRHVELTGTNLLDDPSVRGIVVNWRDITERKRAEQTLRESEERYRAVIEQTIEGIYLGAADTKRVLESNEAFQEMLGYTAEELRGMHIYDFIAHDHENIDSVFRSILERGHHFIGERKYRRKDGSIVDVETSATVISYDNSEVLCTVVRDVTERKILKAQLEHRAFHDPLTDLPNRQLFLDRLGHALARSGRRSGSGVAVLFMDLDGFKVVNDSLGHETGDRLLVEVAKRIKGCLRAEDTLARFAGDEFIVLLEEVEGADGALRVTQRITEEFLRPFVLDGRELVVRLSIGVALGEAPSKSPEDLLRDADTAMYRAKEDAADYRVFDPEMHEQALSRMELENELRRALENDEFTVYYQPKFRLGHRDRIEGVEALVRWEHPQRGFMLPGEFIQIAEETGLIIPIGGWVTKEACRQAKEWQQRYPSEPSLTVCVNLSAAQVRHPGLLKDVRSALRENGLEPGSLILEITEGTLLKDTRVIETVFEELKALGVRLTIDDFGKEYSSLSYLNRLPVDGLKVDRLFLESFGENPSNTIIVEAVISLAHSLGLEVTGEGVESAEQLELLRRMGCDLIQGYHLVRPLPGDRVEQLLANQLIP